MKAAFLALLLASTPAFAQPVAITGVKAWTGGEAPVEDATIVIDNGRIQSVIAHGPTPTGARQIDGRGKVATVALDAAATQVGLVEISAASDTDDRSVASGPLGAAFDTALALDPNTLPVQQARAEGVARAMTFPGAAGNGIFAGLGTRISLARSDLVLRGRAAMFVTAGGGAADAAGGSRGALWRQLRNAFDEARAYRMRRAAGTPRDQLLNHVDLDALLPVLDRQIPLAVNAQREADIRQAIAIGRDYALKIVIIGGAEAWRAAPALAAAQIPVILDPLDALPASYDIIGARRNNAALLANAGVTVSFSVSAQGIYLSYDVGPAIREGAGIAVANGLPYAEALRAITMTPSKIWGDTAPVPKLAAGERADIVLWDGDPLEPSTAPSLILSGGAVVSQETRQTLLRDRYRPAAQ